MGTRIMRGATECAASTLAVDALILPVAARKGDDVGFADLALDVTFGALIGGGIGGVAGGLHNWRLKNLQSEKPGIVESLLESGLDAAEAERRATDLLKVMADMPERQRLTRSVRAVWAD